MAFGSCNIPARTQYSCKDPILHPAAPAPRVLRSQRALRQAASPTHGSSPPSRHPHASPTSCAPFHRRVPAASQTNSRFCLHHGSRQHVRGLRLTCSLTHALLRRCWQPEGAQSLHTEPAHPFMAGSSQSSWRASPRRAQHRLPHRRRPSLPARRRLTSFWCSMRAAR